MHEAANGREALAVMDAHEVDALFTDINMPVMSGSELLRELERQGRRTPARIVVSTDGSDARRQEMEGLARWYVNKPVRPEVVRDVLSELASGLAGLIAAALDRALALVAEESFFAMVDPVPDDLSDVVGPDRPALLSARVNFDGGFAGSLSCTMSRAPRARADRGLQRCVARRDRRRRSGGRMIWPASSPTWCAAAG